MKAVALPTQAEIKEILHYDPETGLLRWRFSRSRNVKPWDVAGCLCNGYFVVGINYKIYYVHRLAWVYMNGKPPENDIDHIDGIRSNNAWQNLREATRKQNNENRPINKNNTSGFRGVSWNKKKQKWMASLCHSKKDIFIGYFDAAEEAGKAAAAKRAELFTHDSRM